MKRVRKLLLGPRTFSPLFLSVFALFLVTLFRADGVQLDRLSVLAATIAAFTAMVLVITNNRALEISQRLLDEAVRQRELNTAPHVAVWLEANEKIPVAVELVLKNIGRGPAYGVETSFVSGAEDYADPKHHLLLLIKNGVEFMAPDREVRGSFGGISYMKDYPFVLAVKYFPSRERKIDQLIEEHFTMNPWEAVKGQLKDPTEEALKTVASELRRMNDRHAKYKPLVIGSRRGLSVHRLGETLRRLLP